MKQAKVTYQLHYHARSQDLGQAFLILLQGAFYPNTFVVPVPHIRKQHRVTTTRRRKEKKKKKKEKKG
jgi:hypothetical protein